MIIVDAHTHFFFPSYFPAPWFQAKAMQWAARTWPQGATEGMPERIENNLLDPDASLLLADLAAAGIDRAICIGLDPGVAFGPGELPDLARHIEQQAEPISSSPRLAGFVGVDPRRPDPAKAVRWAVERLGFRGVKVYAPHGFLPGDPRCHPIYAECVALGVPVMFHTAEAEYPLISEYANPLHLQAVQYAFPELTIILGHAGYPLWHREAVLVARGHPSTFLEVSNWNKLLGRDQQRLVETLHYMKDEVGAHRMIFGSDHYASPRDDGRRREALRAWVELAGQMPIFGPGERELFLGGNISRILGMDSSTEAHQHADA